jgi:hypothetical protein
MYDSHDPWAAATEAEWPSATDPAPLLEAIRGRTSDRKPRLLACACCRRIWDLLSELERNGTDIAERYADGQASEDERWDCLKALLESAGAEVHREVGSCSWAVIETDEIPNAVIAALLNDTEVLVDGQTGRSIRGTSFEGMAYRAIFSATLSTRLVERRLPPASVVQDRWFGRMWRTTLRRLTGSPSPFESERATLFVRERSYQADLVRDIFANPFHPVAFSPEWSTDTAVALARQMYESRDFSAMPILADALQDAGCDSAQILDHCRGPGPHVRGCWVVDLVLGKA